MASVYPQLLLFCAFYTLPVSMSQVLSHFSVSISLPKWISLSPEVDLIGPQLTCSSLWVSHESISSSILVPSAAARVETSQGYRIEI